MSVGQKHIKKVSEILEILAENYENLELLLKELSGIEDAPKNQKEIEAYIQAVSKGLIYREFELGNFFPGASYGELAKLYPPLGKIFEKNQNKTILITKGVREKWMGFHPFLIHFYDGFKIDETFSRKVDVVVTCGPIQIKLDGIELYLPLDEPISSLYEIYIAFNPKDFSYFSPLLKTDVAKLRIDYVINASEQSISVEIKKKEREKERKELKVITRIPELYLEIRDDARELERLACSPFSPYLYVKLKRDELIEKLKELNLENEEFYKSLEKTKEIDEKFGENLSLAEKEEKEYIQLYAKASRLIENYVERREGEIARIREKIIKRMSE